MNLDPCSRHFPYVHSLVTQIAECANPAITLVGELNVFQRMMFEDELREWRQGLLDELGDFQEVYEGWWM
jgi:hypothetical protein